MKSKNIRSLWGLKWNPFTPDVPVEALFPTPRVERLLARVDGLVENGGFALIVGDHGSGKSAVMRLIAQRLDAVREARVVEVSRPQSKISDFYRELGDAFGVSITASNRWGGFKTLREKWRAHLESTLYRAVLLIDEAQEMKPDILRELRLLSSADFDSTSLLTVVLAGDGRLLDLFRHEDLLALGSRIRTRLALESMSRDEAGALFAHLLERAGNSALMTQELIDTLVDHSGGNLRTLMTLAEEVLDFAAREELATLDEKLYFRVFEPEEETKRERGRPRR